MRSRDRWENGLSEMLGGSYVPVKHVHMGQIRLSVYVRSDIFPFVKNVHEKHTATGARRPGHCGEPSRICALLARFGLD